MHITDQSNKLTIDENTFFVFYKDYLLKKELEKTRDVGKLIKALTAGNKKNAKLIANDLH